MVLYAKIYELVDKYVVVGLKELCCQKFARACICCLGTEKLTQAARLAFTTTPDSDMYHRDVFNSTLSKKTNAFDKQETNAIMHEFTSLAMAVLELRKRDLV